MVCLTAEGEMFCYIGERVMICLIGGGETPEAGVMWSLGRWDPLVWGGSYNRITVRIGSPNEKFRDFLVLKRGTLLFYFQELEIVTSAQSDDKSVEIYSLLSGALARSARGEKLGGYPPQS